MTGDITERSGARIDDLRERLRAEYGEFRTVEKTWRHPPGFYEDLIERFEEGREGGAGGWVYDGDGRVLLVRNEGDVGWTDPGGKRGAGETFEETAGRAIREATGVEVSITGVLELHEVEVYDGTAPDRPHLLEPIAVFEARYEDGDPDPGTEEIAAVEWFDSVPEVARYEEVGQRPIPHDPR